MVSHFGSSRPLPLSPLLLLLLPWEGWKTDSPGARRGAKRGCTPPCQSDLLGKAKTGGQSNSPPHTRHMPGTVTRDISASSRYPSQETWSCSRSAGGEAEAQRRRELCWKFPS